MTLLDLDKMVDHEVQWLSYYSTSESRSKLTTNSDVYSDLDTMGYCKTKTPLYFRCSVCLLSNGTEIDPRTDIKTLVKFNGIKGKYDYTPLEAFIKLFPDRKIEIITRLIPKKSNWKSYKSPESMKIPKYHK